MANSRSQERLSATCSPPQVGCPYTSGRVLPQSWRNLGAGPGALASCRLRPGISPGRLRMLRIYLAGRVEVELNGTVAFDERDMRGKQSRAAFAYLALQRDRPVVKDELAEAIWPSDMPQAWESALSALVSRLRSLLPEGSTISGGAGLYQLHLPANTWV